MSKPLHVEQRGDAIEAEHRPVAADELRAVQTESAVAARALHVALHAEPDVSLRVASRLHVSRDHVYLALGAAYHLAHLLRVVAQLIDVIGHSADVPRPQGLPS